MASLSRWLPWSVSGPGNRPAIPRRTLRLEALEGREVPAAVLSVTSPNAAMTYAVGSPVTVEVNFDEAVNVTGTPRLTLETGAIDRTLDYTVGDGTGTLTFAYTVQLGDESADLDYKSTTALVLNGGTIRNGTLADAELTLPAPGAAGSLSANADLVIDGVAPWIHPVLPPANGTYVAGQNLDFTLIIGEMVTVTGTPRINLYVGSNAVAVTADYLTGSGTNSLVFRYVVRPGDSDTDGVRLHYTIDLNGGTIRDAAGNYAYLTIGPPDATRVLVDTVPPTVFGIGRADANPTAAASVHFVVVFDESVTGVDPSDFTVTATGTASGTATTVTGSGTTYTVTVGNVAGIGTLRLDVKASGTGVADAVGNPFSGGYTAGQTYSVDTVPPVIYVVSGPAPGTYTAGQALDFAVLFSEGLTLTGTPRLALTLGSQTVYANRVSNIGLNTLVFRYTVQAGDEDVDGIAVTSPVDLNGGAIRDLAGNAAVLTFTSPTTTGVLVDGVAPTVSSIVRASGNPTVANSVTYTVTFSEAVTGMDVTDFALNTTGSVSGTGLSVAGSGTTYTVTVGGLTGDGTLRLDLNAVATGIQDASGNAIVGGYTGGETYSIDRVVPAVTAVTPPADATYVAGQALEFTFTFDEAVTVTGTPRVALYVGNNIVFADYVSGSSTTALTFGYTVLTSDRDLNGVGSINTVILNGGTIRDGNGNDAVLTFTPPNTSGVLVDGIPRVASVTAPADGTYGAGQALDITVTFTRAVVVNTAGGTPRVAVFLDSAGVYAGYVSGSGTASLLFRYAAQPGDFDTNGLFLGTPVNLNGGTIRDAVGNNATLTFAPPNTAGVRVDTTAPAVTSVTRNSPNPTSAATVTYTVTFSEPVILSAEFGFTLVTAIPGAAVTDVSGDGSTYIVTVSTGTGSGTLRLDLTNTLDVSDFAGNAVATAFTAGDVYTVDRVLPTVVGIARNSPNPTAADTVSYTVTFGEPVTGLDADDFLLTASGVSGASVVSVSGDGTTYIVTVNTGTGSGTLRLDLIAGDTGITDGAGDTAADGFSGGEAYTLDRTMTPVEPPAPPTPTAADAPTIPPHATTVTGYVVTTPQSSTAGTIIKVFDPSTGQNTRELVPFVGYDGPITVTTADLDGDGIPEVLVGAGVGGGPRVAVFDGATGHMTASFFAFDPSFTGGLTVAIGDVDGDGIADIVAGAGPGGPPRVSVFDARILRPVTTFNAFAADFTGGVFLAVGDLDGTGRDRLIVGAGPGGSPLVTVFDGSTGQPLRSVMPYFPEFTGGVVVATTTDDTGRVNIVTGAGVGGGPHVRVFDGRTLEPLASFFAFDSGSRTGVSVG